MLCLQFSIAKPFSLMRDIETRNIKHDHNELDTSDTTKIWKKNIEWPSDNILNNIRDIRIHTGFIHMFSILYFKWRMTICTCLSNHCIFFKSNLKREKLTRQRVLIVSFLFVFCEIFFLLCSKQINSSFQSIQLINEKHHHYYRWNTMIDKTGKCSINIEISHE